jgi:hypothetical protein
MLMALVASARVQIGALAGNALLEACQIDA